MHFLIVLFFAHSNHNSKMINKNVFNQNIHAKQAVDTDKHRPLFVRFYCGVIGGLSHSLSRSLFPLFTLQPDNSIVFHKRTVYDEKCIA